MKIKRLWVQYKAVPGVYLRILWSHLKNKWWFWVCSTPFLVWSIYKVGMFLRALIGLGEM